MNNWIDLIALFLSFVAIWYTIRESRRNNSVVLRIKDCKSTFSSTGPGENVRKTFSIIVRNEGISLHNVEANLIFVPSNGHGRINMVVKRRRPSKGTDEFARGMVAEFYLDSTELDEVGHYFIEELKDLKKQDVNLCIFSQGYLAKEFRIGGRIDRLKLKWNHYSYRFNSLFDRRKPLPDGSPILYTYNVVPKFVTLGWHLESFCKWVRRKDEARAESRAIDNAASPVVHELRT